MKKIIISIICFFSIFSTTNAFFGDPTSIDLYKNIDSGLYELEDKMLGFELNGGERETGVLVEINQLASYNELPRCLDEGKKMSVGKFKQIVEKQNVYELTEYFSDACYNIEEERYPVDLTTSYIYLFNEYLKTSSLIAENKTKRIYQVSSIGQYSDGILENSGFDLITDIEDIDKIIFSKVEEYEGEEYEDLKEFVEKMTAAVDNEASESHVPEIIIPENLSNTTSGGSSGNNNTTSEIYVPTRNDSDAEQTTSNYLCLDNEEDSGLSDRSLDFLLYTIEKIEKNQEEKNRKKSYNSDGTSSGGSESGVAEGEKIEVDEPESDYEKITDNSQWPCDDFFCIDIEFIMYDNELFGENMTIEYLVKRSN
ncbi:MAG: hypothetical protein QM490_00635, partial [Candidatus Gracilibacteria bacterium]